MYPSPNIDNSRTGSLPFMPQLDALRAFAVMAVVFHHFLGGVFGAFEGVKLFFVLSGFLITSILLRGREIRETSGKSWSRLILNFYTRRAIRIFPLYYLMIVLGLILNLEPVREALVWFLTYTLNIYMVELGWFVANYAHFWSLAVEEQFYIVWPWLIFFLPRKSLIPLTIVIILVGPLFRFYAVTQELNWLTSYIFTPACLDTLGMGSLLALIAFQDPKYSLPQIVRSNLGYIGFPILLLASAVLVSRGLVGLYIVFYDLFLAFVFCGLISKASRGFNGFTGKLLESRPLTYIGKISYGIYVYHPFIPLLCATVSTAFGISLTDNKLIALTYLLPITFGVASISWHVFERPINSLKRSL